MHCEGTGVIWGQGSDRHLGKCLKQRREGWGSALGGPKMTLLRTWGTAGAGNPGGVGEVQVRLEEDPEGGDGGFSDR